MSHAVVPNSSLQSTSHESLSVMVRAFLFEQSSKFKKLLSRACLAHAIRHFCFPAKFSGFRRIFALLLDYAPLHMPLMAVVIVLTHLSDIKKECPCLQDPEAKVAYTVY